MRETWKGSAMADEPTCQMCGSALWGDDGYWYIFECQSRLSRGDGSFEEHVCCKTAQIAALQAENEQQAFVIETLGKRCKGLEGDKATLQGVVDENHDWCCSCGDWNGPNLAKCGMCGRTRQESLPPREASEAAGGAT